MKDPANAKLVKKLSSTQHEELVEALASCAAFATAYQVELGLDPQQIQSAGDVQFAVWRALRERARRVRARDN